MIALTINGQNRSLAGLTSPTNLAEVVGEMGLKADRVAVEHNGEIAPRARWADIPICSGDRLEVVQFVGGGVESKGRCDGIAHDRGRQGEP